ncbi:MAG TPA: TadE/TadG family type IV pilus assembly protein [Devosia sp.]|jgi:Flp pilus assembly protein TadG|uniref:TadE/TadG family type IV pilus assembly protein n=1 Tax=Devosia sp. TaxID=1871048 RepID=UPI002F93308A
MRAIYLKLLSHLRTLWLAQQGAAAIEFALILPIMLTVYVGSVEGSTMISMDRRVQSVAGSIGDLVARTNGKLETFWLTDYFKASAGIMTPYPIGDLKQVVTQVEVKADGSTVVIWSYEYAGNKLSTKTNYAPLVPAEMINIAKGKFVVVAEASYTFTPLSGFVYTQPIGLYRQNFFMPRFGTKIEVK